MVAVNGECRVFAGVPGLCPGLVVQLPGEPGRVKRHVSRAWVIGAGWGRLTRAGESGTECGGGHGALGVGRRFADCVPAWEEAPVIHPVARGGPGCRAVLGGSIKRAAVLLEVERRPDIDVMCSRRSGRAGGRPPASNDMT